MVSRGGCNLEAAIGLSSSMQSLGLMGRKFIADSSVPAKESLRQRNRAAFIINKSSESGIHWEYVDFDLEIGEQREARTYLVSVRSPEGEAQEEMRFPFDEWELKDRLKKTSNSPCSVLAGHAAALALPKSRPCRRSAWPCSKPLLRVM